MNSYWAMLDIAPTNDLKVIKRAYATRLKLHRPDDDPEYFQRLREAYEWACQIGVHQLETWEDEYDDYDDASDEAEPAHAATLAQAESTDSPLTITQSLPALTTILASVPTHFPTTFDPPPSPTFPASAPANKPPVDLDASAHLSYALNSGPLNQRMRSMSQVIAAFWTQSNRLKTVPEIQIWLQAQPEYESLHLRPNLEDALADAFTEQPWPWPAVLAVAELLDWGTIGNLIGAELNQALQLAHLQQRGSITTKPRWYQFLTKTATAHFLLSPFSWPKALFSALLPRTQHIDELCDEVARLGVDPALVFNPEQIEFQRKLRVMDFNFPRIAYALMRLVGWPVLFSSLFIGAAAIAPLVGLIIGLPCFAIWLGFVENHLLFRTIWTPNPSGANSKAFWLSIGITLAITGICTAFKWPNFAVLFAVFMLFAVAKDGSDAFASAVLGSLFAFVTAASIWPTQAPEKFLITAPVTLSLVMIVLYFYQRRLPAEKLMARLLRPPSIKPIALPVVENFNWWWIVGGILLIRLLAVGH